MSVAAVVVAAGEGRRFGAEKGRKQFLELEGRPVLAWSMETLSKHELVDEVVAVVPSDIAVEPPGWLRALADRVVAGGRIRGESVARGVAALRARADGVLIHDGVRPFVTATLVGRVAEAAAGGPVIPVIPVVDTMKEVDEDGRVVRTLDRARLVRVQTPQGFPLELIADLYADGIPEDATDDATVCEARGIEVRTVPGDPDNLKITSPSDLELARCLAARRRVGV